jgi:hypothetical protein
VAAKVFGLSHAVIDCSEHTSLDDFAHAILSGDATPVESNSPVRTRQDSYFLNAPTFQSIAARSPISDNFADNKTIANVIIAKNLDEAPKQVQIQALELMRTKRIYTRTSVQNAPKRFLFIALLAGGEGPRLTKHLNDQMFISHFHDPEDGFPNLEEDDDGNSISSVVKKSPISSPEPWLLPMISALVSDMFVCRRTLLIKSQEIEHLSQLSDHATVTVELKQYQQNIISFLRLHRAVGGGISAQATQHFDKLAMCLAPLHNLSYATPSLIALAARKAYPHRVHIVQPEKERSMQWGSNVDAVASLLEGIGAEDVIEDVLGIAGAETPL